MKPGKSQTGQKEKPRVEAVERALGILEAFADGVSRLTLSELAQKTGLYPSTVLRLSNSLEEFGYMHRDSDGFFRLGPTLWRLGVLYQNAFNLERHVRPVLQYLVDSLGETAAFYVREKNWRICLYRRFANSSIGHHVEEGARLPLDRGASAHVLMAFTGATGEKYGRIRSERLYISEGERNPDACSVAVPVFGPSNEFVGALSVIGPRNRMVGETLQTSISVIQEGAQRLSRSMRGR